MDVCEKTSVVTVTGQDDGTFTVEVDTPCDNVREFVAGLGPLTMADLVDKANSGVFQRMREAKMSANCLFPSGLLSAAWLEAGLIARSRASRRTNRVEFLAEDD